MNLISTWNNLVKAFSFANFLAIEDHEQGALIRLLLLSYSSLKQLLWESVTDKFH